MLETGYKVDTLNTPQDMNGVPVVPVYIGATHAALERHHQMFGIAESVLLIDEGLTNPVTGKGALRHLPGLAVPGDRFDAYAPEVDFGAMRESSGKNSH
jgi:hypothetical protein